MANRVVAGHVGAGVYAFRVSKPGVNVLTASGADLLMDSEAEQFRVLQTGQITLPIGDSSESVSVSGIGTSQLFMICYGVAGSTQVFPAYVASTGLVISYTGTQVTVTRSDTSTAITISYAVLGL